MEVNGASRRAQNERNEIYPLGGILIRGGQESIFNENSSFCGEAGKRLVKHKEPEPCGSVNKVFSTRPPVLMLYVYRFQAGTAPATSLDAGQPG